MRIFSAHRGTTSAKGERGTGSPPRYGLGRTLFPRIVVLLLLLVLLARSAVPGYLTGRWSWAQPLPVTTLKQIKQLRQTGLTLPSWQIIQQQQQIIGGHKWSVQVIKQERKQMQAILLLLPQNGPAAQPQVEWTDINGAQRWNTDQYHWSQFTVEPLGVLNSGGATKVEARFFRGWTDQQTFAVLEWYAWPTGGHAVPSRWFWADQLAQWRYTRVPWVAVSILIPIEPLGEVETSWPLAQSLGQTVQAALMAGPFLRTGG